MYKKVIYENYSEYYEVWNLKVFFLKLLKNAYVRFSNKIYKKIVRFSNTSLNEESKKRQI